MTRQLRFGDCRVEITSATRKHSATWFVTHGERQKDGIANTTADARRDAREAAASMGCRLRKRR